MAAVAPGLDLDRIADALDRLWRRLTGVVRVGAQGLLGVKGNQRVPAKVPLERLLPQ